MSPFIPIRHILLPCFWIPEPGTSAWAGANSSLLMARTPCRAGEFTVEFVMGEDGSAGRRWLVRFDADAECGGQPRQAICIALADGADFPLIAAPVYLDAHERRLVTDAVCRVRDLRCRRVGHGNRYRSGCCERRRPGAIEGSSDDDGLDVGWNRRRIHPNEMAGRRASVFDACTLGLFQKTISASDRTRPLEASSRADTSTCVELLSSTVSGPVGAGQFSPRARTFTGTSVPGTSGVRESAETPVSRLKVCVKG